MNGWRKIETTLGEAYAFDDDDGHTLVYMLKTQNEPHWGWWTRFTRETNKLNAPEHEHLSLAERQALVLMLAKME
jgi:hypothetical protein